MIIFTRLTGGTIAVNPDLIERAEETPDTVITLVDEKKFLVKESLEQVIQLIGDYRAYVIARSRSLEVVEVPHPTLHLVPNDTIVGSHTTDSGHQFDSNTDDSEVVALLDRYAPRSASMTTLPLSNKTNDLAEPDANVKPNADAEPNTS